MASHDLNKVNAIVWFIQIAWWTFVVETSSGWIATKARNFFFNPFKLSYHALNVCSSHNLYEQKRVKHLITVRERYAPTRITPSIRLLVKGIVYFTAPYSIATLIRVVAFNTTHNNYLTHVIGLSLAPWFALLLAVWKKFNFATRFSDYKSHGNEFEKLNRWLKAAVLTLSTPFCCLLQLNILPEVCRGISVALVLLQWNLLITP